LAIEGEEFGFLLVISYHALFDTRIELRRCNIATMLKFQLIKFQLFAERLSIYVFPLLPLWLF